MGILKLENLRFRGKGFKGSADNVFVHREVAGDSSGDIYRDFVVSALTILEDLEMRWLLGTAEAAQCTVNDFVDDNAVKK